jgi:hypothetical protein
MPNSRHKCRPNVGQNGATKSRDNDRPNSGKGGLFQGTKIGLMQGTGYV